MTAKVETRSHYLFVNMRDWGCNCGARPDGRPVGTEDLRVAWFAEHMAEIAEPAVMTPVPNKPKTPLRSFRIPDEVYEAAQAKAAERGETVSDVVRRALERYGKRP
jgi:hypothetical protein